MRIGGLLTLGPPALTGAGERPLVARLGTAAPFLLGALLTGLVSADHGGYWPTAWGWTTFALVWAAGIALVFGGEAVSRLELAWIGGLVAVTVWTAASLLWTASRTATALELERTLVYVGAATAAAAVVRAAGYRGLVWGVWAGSSAASLYGLATRLLPVPVRTAAAARTATRVIARQEVLEPLPAGRHLRVLLGARVDAAVDLEQPLHR